MIGALVAIISLNFTTILVNAGQVAATLPITGATATTPVAITCPAHGVPLGRVVHGVVAGVGGVTGANGTWVATPTDADTFTLSAFTGQGATFPSVGVGSYTGGGTLSYAFPDYQILLGRRFVALGTAVASPRIVFVPTTEPAFGFDEYGGVFTSPPGAGRGNAEQQAEKLQPQLATQHTTFEVYVTGAANPPSPDFGDFDAAQAIAQGLYASMFDTMGARVKMLRGDWPSQKVSSGTQTQRGQQWMGIFSFSQPVTDAPLTFVPSGTSLVITVEPQGGSGSDVVTITIPNPP